MEIKESEPGKIIRNPFRSGLKIIITLLTLGFISIVVCGAEFVRIIINSLKSKEIS